MEKTGLLLVEGNDDLHVCASLFRRHGIPYNFSTQNSGGIRRLLDSLPVRLKASNICRLGVVVDADTGVDQRWRQLRSILLEAKFLDLPGWPSAEGTITENEAGLRVGVWVMPNNALPGKLEDFVALMVPDGDPLWLYARSCINHLPERRFRDADSMKSLVHTWLAWQRDPGTPMGLAITRKYLETDGPEARRFLTWIRRLLDDGPGAALSTA